MMQEAMKAAIVGAGGIFDTYANTIIKYFPIVNLKAVYDINSESAEKKAEEFHIISTALEDILADKEIELVIILTPLPTHYELIKQALAAGKHVYSEKLMTSDYAEAKEMKELAEEKGVYLCAAPDTFLDITLQTARKIIEDGKIGEVTSFSVTANRNNDILLSIIPFLRKPGIGVTYDYAVYYITALVNLFGPVERVFAVTRKPYPKHINMIPGIPDFGKEIDAPNESQLYAIIQFRNGLTGTFQINADSIMIDQGEFNLYGKKGILKLGDPDFSGHPVMYVPESRDISNPPAPEPLPFTLERSAEESYVRGVGIAEMVISIREGKVSRTNADMVCHVIEVLNAMMKSHETECYQSITSTFNLSDPVREKI